ncbi:polysaccharide lyase family 3 protein [Coleophoma cylindrospora]|uniref:Pectate lyase n=1 Tax=Coleophoma cylindrospora TaxID=1849047 RepID=A0A3D8STM9_9HELO|nr:polysaccharide lyase family 3 protein [Coleophoma cylindrospora]
MQFQVAALTALFATLGAAQTLNIPTRVGSVVALSAPSTISGVHDMGNKEYDRGHACNSDKDTGSSSAVFILADGATLSNVIIGANALEGVHCEGKCTLKNVWFRDVCEDAITIKGTGDVLIQGGGAQNAKDKVVQHNGKGTVTIKDYTVVNVGKLFRSCGNCSKQYGPRNVILSNVKANTVTADLVGINSNYGDVATISGSCATGLKGKVCQEFKGIVKNGSQESPKLSSTANCQGAQGKSIPAC